MIWPKTFSINSLKAMTGLEMVYLHASPIAETRDLLRGGETEELHADTTGRQSHQGSTVPVECLLQELTSRFFYCLQLQVLYLHLNFSRKLMGRRFTTADNVQRVVSPSVFPKAMCELPRH